MALLVIMLEPDAFDFKRLIKYYLFKITITFKKLGRI